MRRRPRIGYRHTSRSTQLVGERFERSHHVLLGPRQHVKLRILLPQHARLAGISEEADRWLGCAQHHMFDAGEHFERAIDHIGNSVDRHAPAPARKARHLSHRAQLRSGRDRDAMRRIQTALAERRSREQQQCRLLRAQRERDRAHGLRRYCGALRRGERRRRSGGLVPRGVRGQNKRGDIAGRA